MLGRRTSNVTSAVAAAVWAVTVHVPSGELVSNTTGVTAPAERIDRVFEGNGLLRASGWRSVALTGSALPGVVTATASESSGKKN